MLSAALEVLRLQAGFLTASGASATGRVLRRSLGLVGGAETAGEEAEHEEDLGDPEVDVEHEVIGHSPWHSSPSWCKRDRAERHGVGGEQEDSGGDEGSELEDAGEEGAVD